MEMQFVNRQYVVNYLLDKIASGENLTESEETLLTEMSESLFNLNEVED